MDQHSKFKDYLLDYDKDSAKELLIDLKEVSGISIINNVFYEALKDIGEEWDKGNLSLSQVYMSGVLCEEIINEIFRTANDINQEQSNVAIVTFSDFHTLGKKILLSYFSISGYAIKDFGNTGDIPKLVEKCISEDIRILIISVLMLPSALKIKALRSAFNDRNYEIVLLAGGAPFIFNKQLYKEVGADDTGTTPTDAINLVDKWRKKISRHE